MLRNNYLPTLWRVSWLNIAQQRRGNPMNLIFHRVSCASSLWITIGILVSVLPILRNCVVSEILACCTLTFLPEVLKKIAMLKLFLALLGGPSHGRALSPLVLRSTHFCT
ncbi:hypothetical protein K470DRAFT_160011 [Piedraia hortae CBS 480.64]|uniref:Uncharacterized protein n=1 Tax=Piedraia hortae CBS 480.64 TaxID=1314780 RepID=A0A6A7BS59_9PEZI|nr:hypothetical protein K470DRAFT_160011 [Piedraia hortae CBS 480.64]